VTDTHTLEMLLGAGGEVRLGRREAQDVLQKLRARGAASDSADRLESQLSRSDEVVLAPNEAQSLLEELRASGRRWISGTDAPREPPPSRTPEPEPKPEPEPEPEPERPGRLRRLWRR
jgi:hypothetical protein